MDLVLALHSHLPYVLNHGRWPHGSDWLCEAAVDTYLPLLEVLNTLEVERVASPVTLGITPVLANQLAHPALARELTAFLEQRLAACDEAIAAFGESGETHLAPIAVFWRGRLNRLKRLFERVNGDLIHAFRHHEAAGRIEIMSSAATHGFLPLLARDESIRLQLALGRSEHIRLFGRAPRGCWAPECAYRPRGPWHPHPDAPYHPSRAGTEEHLGAAGYRYFFSDAHIAQAGRTLGLYREPDIPDGLLLAAEDPLDLPAARSPYRTYQVSPQADRPVVTTLVRDPRSSRRVWSRQQGYPGDGAYLEFHKIRYPGGLKFWRVTDPTIDLGGKLPYDPNIARARAYRDARDYAHVLREIDEQQGEGAIVVPFDTELFGHWWFEGVDFLGDLYRQLARRPIPRPATASHHLQHRPAGFAVELAEGSWGANGDFSKWLNPDTEWTWRRLWALEDRFWGTVSRALGAAENHFVLAQATRELLLAQASDWQFIISSATAADYATRRFGEHLEACERLLDAITAPGAGGAAGAAGAAGAGGAVELAAELGRRNDLFPDVLPALAIAARGSGTLVAA
jgi:1,4-alpha-glucan branching enzyme